MIASLVPLVSDWKLIAGALLVALPFAVTFALKPTPRIRPIISKPLNWGFDPLPDITAFELACLLPYITNAHGLSHEVFAKMGTEKRHLKILP